MAAVLDPHDDQRIRKLEENTARLDERVKGVSGQVRELAEDVAPLAAEAAGTAEVVRQMRHDLAALRTALEDRASADTADRRASKGALVTVIGSLGVATITAIGGLVTVFVK